MKFIAASCLVLILGLAAAAQSPSKVLNQAEKAMGGSKALKSVRSVRRSGRITRLSDGAEGAYLFQVSQPNLLNISYDLGGFETETGFNGRSGWTRNSRDGLQTLTGSSSVGLQAAAIFRNNLWLRYKDEKAKLTSGGRAVVDGKNANVLILSTQKGIVIKLFFDAIAGMLIRDEVPMGELMAVTDYGEYRVISGVPQPFFERITLGNDIFEIRHDDIRINTPIGVSEFNFPVLSNEPLPSIESLLQEVQANEDKVEAIIDNYSYVQKSIKRELGKDGVLRETESETVQLSFYKGRRISRLMEKNGRPLNAREQADADKDAAKRVEEIEKEIAKEDAKMLKQDRAGTPSSDSRRVSIAEVLRASKLLNPRRERFRGRDVIVFDFEPNPDFDMRNAKSMLKFFGKTAGVMWIDEKDKQVARLEAVLFESYKVGGGVLAKLQKGASFTLEKERVNDEVWLPSQADINLSVRVLLVKGISVNQLIRSYDYRIFETEVTDSKVNDISKP
jgi:hypothetical protein